jgi:hypothetical protein
LVCSFVREAGNQEVRPATIQLFAVPPRNVSTPFCSVQIWAQATNKFGAIAFPHRFLVITGCCVPVAALALLDHAKGDIILGETARELPTLYKEES